MSPTQTELPPILGLHHFAYRCRDAEQTRHFYEDLLGLPLFHYIRSDTVPSTGEHCPYVHIFFRLRNGGCLAFFDLGDDVAALPSPNTPAWVNHLALEVENLDALHRVKARLEANGIEVVGITDHRVFQSIYFFDPNGIRLELSAQLADEAQMTRESQSARRRLDEWTAEKRARLAAKS